MQFISDIKQMYGRGDTLTKLIFINVSVFLLWQLVSVSLRLFNVSDFRIVSYVALPASVSALLYRPWTLLTYMFLHEGFFHIIFNMLGLFWFGKLFMIHFFEKQLVGLYIFGGLGGAIVYIVAFHIFPFYTGLINLSVLLGASGSIMAIIVATAVKAPNMIVNLLLIGNVKLKYIAIGFVLISFLGITSDNGGGQLAHLGGAIVGYLFVWLFLRGIDTTKGVSWLLDIVHNIFQFRKQNTQRYTTQKNYRMSDAEFNANKARKAMDIDRILDKIKDSGYQSLTAEEKKRLFESH